MIEIDNDLEEMCKIDDVSFIEIKKLVENSKSNISNRINNLFTHSNAHCNTSQQDFLNLLVLRVYNNIKSTERNIILSKQKNITYTYRSIYATNINKCDMNMIRTITRQTDNNKKQEMSKILCNVMGCDKMMKELIYCELLHYTPLRKQEIRSNKEISKIIKSELDRFFYVLYPDYIEDKEWSLFTPLIKVPKGTLLFVNTIGKKVQTLMFDIIKKYINRVYNIPTIRYMLHEDANYDMFWIIFAIKV